MALVNRVVCGNRVDGSGRRVAKPVNRSSPELKEKKVGKTPRCSLPPVPPGRAEAIFERLAVLHGEVRD
jgi:hypothetical protein